MKVAVDYGLYDTRVVLDNGKKKSLPKPPDRVKFVRTLSEKDEVYCEFGAGADKFALACIRKGVKVFRVPTNVLKSRRNGDDKKDDASLILRIAKETPGVFYEITPKSIEVIEIGLLIQEYYIIQALRKATDMRLFGALADSALIEDDLLGSGEKEIRKKIAKHPIFHGVDGYEDGVYQKLDKLVRKSPLYKEMFDSIVGVGGVIGGQIIYSIGDIKRFPTSASLKNYAGYGFNGDGIQKRKKGQVSNWSSKLKQAVFLFCDQANRRKGTVWGDMLLKRKEYERGKFPDASKGHIHAKAFRYVGQKFLEHVWKEWRKFEGLN